MRFEQTELEGQIARLEVLRNGSDSTADGRILLLTSGLGLGHVRAAQAIERALEGAATVETVDFWSLINPGVAKAIHETYLSLVQNYPDLHERLYQLDEDTWRLILESESGPPRAVLEVLELISKIAAEKGETAARGGKYASDRMLLSLLCAALPYDGDSLAGNGVRARLALLKWTWLRLIRRLEPAIKRFAPDVIVSTQMIPAAMVSYLKQRDKIRVPLVGVMTDFGVHDFWKQSGIDRYCVAHESIVSREAGDLTDPIIATGVPLMPAFAAPLSQEEARFELHVPQKVPIVLVLGGGLGLSVDSAARELLQHPGESCIIAMPGKNTAAREALERLALRHPKRLRVCQWTERMDLFLRAADVVVGKPGGISVAEALACGRPLLATRSLGGQEGFNVNFLERNEVGGLVSEHELVARVDSLLANREQLQKIQNRAWALGRRDGAAQVAHIALELAAARPSVALGTL
ncbi:MAG: glycosyltransferase [Xanthomonadaceae bacterium]|nr:glycosyltransferase [Xanthomonadaceae bacterium]